MMRDEFVTMVEAHGCPCTISTEQYQLVEFIYTWHPVCRSKADIVDLWLLGGPKLLQELRPRAERKMERSRRVDEMHKEIEKMHKEIERLINKIQELEDADE